MGTWANGMWVGAIGMSLLLLARGVQGQTDGLSALTRVLPDGSVPADARLGRCRHLNLRMTMGDYPTRAAWETRAAWLREHIRASCGLLPAPRRTPLKPRVFGKIDRAGYTIEKAFIESRPGFYCTGNLYRPRGKTGPFPGVACPHGHGRRGRIEPTVRARCVTLARLGYVVFSYDMVGYNDSGKQVGAHRTIFTKPADELWGLSHMCLQSWNTIRAIDFLQSLDDVDDERIAVTGCSGGGTQTFMVMGIEPRVKVAGPVCMISGIMQGGCICENAPLLRIETNNIEIAALMAPRPLIMPSVTGDWTKETPKVEYPSVRSIYELYAAADRVANPHIESKHGYPKPHRESVYGFFQKHLCGIGKGGKVPEPDVPAEKDEDLLVFHGRKLPADAKTPKTLRQYMVAECRRQRAELLPAKAGDYKRFNETLGACYHHAVMASQPKASELAVEELGTRTVGDLRIRRLLLGTKTDGEKVPALLYRSKGASGKTPGCVVVHGKGKAALIDADKAAPGKLLTALLAGGRSVLAVDPYLTGEYGQAKQKTVGKYFTTYNRTPLVYRVQDILTALAYLKARRSVGSVSLVGVGRAGAWCLLAAPFAPKGTPVVADMHLLAGDDDPRWLGDLFTPCILKAGGCQTAGVILPGRLFLHNLSDDFDVKSIRAAYRAADISKHLRTEARPARPASIVDFLGTE